MGTGHIHGRLTPQNSAVILIDHQPQMTFGVASIDRQPLVNNTLLLAKAAKIFLVPTILWAATRLREARLGRADRATRFSTSRPVAYLTLRRLGTAGRLFGGALAR